MQLSQLAEHQGITVGQLIALQMHNQTTHQGIIIVGRMLGGSTHPAAAHSRYGSNRWQERGCCKRIKPFSHISVAGHCILHGGTQAQTVLPADACRWESDGAQWHSCSTLACTVSAVSSCKDYS